MLVALSAGRWGGRRAVGRHRRDAEFAGEDDVASMAHLVLLPIPDHHLSQAVVVKYPDGCVAIAY